MKKKLYFAPISSVETVVSYNTMQGFSHGPKPEPGAPARQGEGSSVKLTKMYI